ncbi:hypothetical protein NUW58_g514 [Xylaria curta]|uniref:Uncharacterized protein n=1 Tax=Xylaria curta TaxID=42375 RepID=A0ACC1PQR0_9PEZI|nr:hypothetical protein NUW58_g514 [Xylaria curta]
MPSMTKWLKRLHRDGSDSSAQVPSTAADEHPQGLEVVYEGPGASLDIVAVHGLNGHREKTWTAANGVHWLRDLLPKDLPGVRVLTWGYDVNTHSSGRVSCQYLYDHALELVSDLTRKRKLTESVERPIIFVAHSLGGLVVKSALIHSDAARQGALREHRSIKTSTYGAIYIGTPHQGGSGVQLGRALVNIASIFIAADDRILKHLERDSEWLQQQLSQYNPISNEFVTKFAYETYETPTMLGHKILVVPKASAVVPGQADAEPIAIHADHINMVKFENVNRDYTKVSEILQIMTKDAGGKIQSRWEAEARVDNARKDTNTSLLTPHVFQARLPCYYIPIYRNNRFTGRDAILGELQERLFVNKESQKLALVGLGGVGKTQVALQLAYWVKETKPDYSIFWVPALSDESFEQAYAEIARRLDIQAKNDEDKKMLVRRYFESETAGDLFLIVDNVDDMELIFGSSDSPGGIDEYLPKSENASILYTTRSREVAVAVAGSDVVDLHEMDSKEALEFLKKSLINKQLLQDTVATETLFQELTCLPLAIAQAAAYLNQNQMSIKKYLSLLWNTEQDLVNLVSREFHDDTRYPGSQNAVATTWLVSFDQIRRANSNAADMLSFHVLRVGREYYNREWFDLLYGVGSCLRDDRRFKEAIVALEEVYKWTKQHLAEEDDDRLNMEHTLAIAYTDDRRIKDAIEMLEHIVAIGRKKELAGEGLSRLAYEHSLGSAYLIDRRIKEAIAIFERVVAMQQKTLAEEDNFRLTSEHELASAYLEN